MSGIAVFKVSECRQQGVRAATFVFQRYFHWLKQLGWVEFTGHEESYSAAPLRKYYRLMQAPTALKALYQL